MFIQTEITPNPATLKFIPGREMMPSGTMDFQNVEQAVHAPLARRLFALQGVCGVFYGQDFISVTKDEDTDWSMLKSMVLAALMEHLSTDQPILDAVAMDNDSQSRGDHNRTRGDSARSADAASKTKEEQDAEDEIVDQIIELLDTRVRPAVARDGGDIVFEAYDDGIVYLRMQGACAGCPSSTATLKVGIENMLKHFIPEVMEVREAPFY